MLITKLRAGVLLTAVFFFFFFSKFAASGYLIVLVPNSNVLKCVITATMLASFFVLFLPSQVEVDLNNLKIVVMPC